MRHVVISRTDRIGDVVLTLPLAGLLKTLPNPPRITFLGAAYTRDVVACCPHVDAFVAWEELESQPVAGMKALGADVILHVFPRKEIALAAWRAGIPLRVGTRNRAVHWVACNRLLALSRRHSPLHESQLNLKFAEVFGVNRDFSLVEIAGFSGFRPREVLAESLRGQLDPARINLIFHPKSKGSAREWPLENFIRLAHLLPPATHRIFVTGTQAEGDLCRPLLEAGLPHLHDLTGQLALPQLIAFIAAADGLLANSTGPVHLSAALGRPTVGLYPTARPLDPGRWAPLGPLVRVLTGTSSCAGCPVEGGCSCLAALRPEVVAAALPGRFLGGGR